MRWPAVVLAALLALIVPAGAQEAAPLLEDDADDVVMQTAGSAQPPAVDWYGDIDLRSLTWIESAEAFEFRLGVRDLAAAPASTPLDDREYEIGFTFDGVDYGIRIRSYGGAGSGSYWAVMGERGGGYDYYDHSAYIDVTPDAATDTLVGLVPRDALVDDRGAPASAGEKIEAYYVIARSRGLMVYGGPNGNESTLSAWDRMPDSGVDGLFEVELGVPQEGDARLHSEAPFRLSNGGATTIVYQVEASTLGERQTFKLAVEQVPPGWNVELPFDRIVLESNETRTFPVLLTTPSGHQHGGSQKFMLTMKGERHRQDMGRTELGIQYTTIPQPAGHHPRLHLHSYRPYGDAPAAGLEDVPMLNGVDGYFNAAPPDDDASDTQESIPASGSGLGLGTPRWRMRLMPELGIGLDFDPSRNAKLSLPLAYEYVAQDVEVQAWLVYGSRGDWTRVGTSVPQAPFSMGPQGSQTVEIEMEIAPEADFLEYSEGAFLSLEIELDGVFLGPPGAPKSVPVIEPGGWLDLPLSEYHDPIDAFYAAVESLVFEAEYLEKQANAGKTVLFRTTLRNVRTEAEPVALNLTGVNGQWARVLGADRFELGAGKQREVAVAVVVPLGTADGALADLVLQAVSVNDPVRRAVMDLVVVVDNETDHPDEAGEVDRLNERLERGKKSPGIPALAALALGAALLRRRR